MIKRSPLQNLLLKGEAGKDPSTGRLVANQALNQGVGMAEQQAKQQAANYLGSQIGLSGSSLLGGAGVGLAAYDLIKNRPGRLEGAIKGGIAGGVAGGPWGALIGAPVGFAASYMNPGYSKLEKDNRKFLMENYGVDLGEDKAWESNPEFARTRDEKYLRPEDITTAADFYLKLGPGYRDASEEVKRNIAGEALARGILRERNGGIELETDEQGGNEFMNYATQALAKPVASTTSRPKEKKKEPKPEKPVRQLTLEELMPKFEYKPQVQDTTAMKEMFQDYLSKKTAKANRMI